MPELWDIYDKNRKKTGKTIKRGSEMSRDEYHLVVQVWIRNSAKEWLISKRTANKSMPLISSHESASVLY